MSKTPKTSNKEKEPVVTGSPFCGWTDGVMTTPEGKTIVLR